MEAKLTAWTTMEMTMSEELKQRLSDVAQKQNREIGEFIQEALFTYVEDIEDGVMAYVALKEDGLDHYLTEGATPVGLDDSIYQASRKTA